MRTLLDHRLARFEKKTTSRVVTWRRVIASEHDPLPEAASGEGSIVRRIIALRTARARG